MWARRSGGVTAALAAGVLAACALVTGVGDLQETACVADCGTDPGDASGSEGPACAPSGPELCSDGIDNDCNGLVDCADPACASFVCVPAAPSGSGLIVLAADSRPACPSGYAVSRDVLVDPGLGPYSCGCSCSVGASPSCTTGTPALTGGTGCATVDTAPANGGACTIHNFNVPLHKLQALPATGGSCTSSVTSVPPAAGTNGRTCGVSGPVGGGCGAGNVCVPKPAAPYGSCIAVGASKTCPAAYPSSHITGSGLASDTRACGPCAPCGLPTATCANAAMSFFTLSDCSGPPIGTLPADGMCDPTNWMAAAYEYKASVTKVACPAASPAQPSGSASLSSPETLCCLP